MWVNTDKLHSLSLGTFFCHYPLELTHILDFTFRCTYVPELSVPGACRNQKRASDLLELELQVVMSRLIWVLGTKLQSSGKAVTPLTAESFLQPLVSYIVSIKVSTL